MGRHSQAPPFGPGTGRAAGGHGGAAPQLKVPLRSDLIVGALAGLHLRRLGRLATAGWAGSGWNTSHPSRNRLRGTRLGGPPPCALRPPGPDGGGFLSLWGSPWGTPHPWPTGGPRPIMWWRTRAAGPACACWWATSSGTKHQPGNPHHLYAAGNYTSPILVGCTGPQAHSCLYWQGCHAPGRGLVLLSLGLARACQRIGRP